MVLQEMLKEVTESTAEAVRKLTEGYALAVYEGQPNADNDNKVKVNFEIAIEACKQWIRSVQAAQIIECNGDDISAKTILFLPGRTVTVQRHTSDYKYCEKTLLTPIGEMDYFTYKAIVNIPNNPVKLLFIYISDLIHQLHNIISMPNHCGEHGLLHSHIVEGEDIVDVLGVYVCDSLWYDLDRFFDVKLEEGLECW